MAELTKEIHEEFTEAEIQALAHEEGKTIDSCDTSLVDNGDGTHTYHVTAK